MSKPKTEKREMLAKRRRHLFLAGEAVLDGLRGAGDGLLGLAEELGAL